MKLISIAQFWEFVDRSGGFFACWPWEGAIAANGYGSFKRHGRAHRVAYELLNGPIPEGMTLDHTCHNGTGCTLSRECPHRRCCNPFHLEPVTNRENILRGESPSAMHAKKTHCPQGHEYSPENTYQRPNGIRECRTCIRERLRLRTEAGYNTTPKWKAYHQERNRRLRESGYFDTPERKAARREYERARYHRLKGH